MFKPVFNKTTFNEQEERDKLNKLSEKELLIEAILEMKKLVVNATIFREKSLSGAIKKL